MAHESVHMAGLYGLNKGRKENKILDGRLHRVDFCASTPRKYVRTVHYLLLSSPPNSLSPKLYNRNKMRNEIKCRVDQIQFGKWILYI